MSEYTPTIICFQEHFLKAAEMSHFVIPNYKLVDSYCRSNILNGGVAIYAKQNFKIEQFALKFSRIEQHIEYSCSKFLLFNTNCVLLNIYRSPTGNLDLFLESLEEILNYLFSMNNFIIVCGDFNVDLKPNSTQLNTAVALEGFLPLMV